MKKIFTFLFCLSLFWGSTTKAQIGYSHQVDSIIQLITIEGLTPLMQQLTGVIPTTVNEQTVTIASRHFAQPGNNLAAQYILERFQEMGYTPTFQTFGNDGGQNVIATKTGTTYPSKFFIVCGHYDSMPSGALAPGADDNASGTIGVLEAARVLKNFPTDYSIVFIAFDEEERGLFGAKAYAANASALGMDIQGVINLDMIAYDGNNDNKVSLISNQASAVLSDEIISTIKVYTPELKPIKKIDNTANSDHAPFWPYGYKAMLIIEDLQDFHPHYHTVNDNITHINWPYFQSNVRLAIASLLSMANDLKMNFIHTPLASGNSTDSREASVVIKTNHTLASGTNSPRLYYSTDGVNFDFLAPSYNNLDTFKFLIPGQELGTTVNYYFAAQDAQGRFVATHPSGGRGTNPPGTIQPESFINYQVANISQFEICSTTLPKPIPDKVQVRDTISIAGEGNIIDVKVKVNITHTWVGDLGLYLQGPNGQEITLSYGAGGSGDNYTNTIFDDQAELSIQQGTPPFTGSFRPNHPLSTFEGIPMAGDWVFRAYDNYNGDQGTLHNYCLIITHSMPAAPQYFNVDIAQTGEGTVNPATGSHEILQGTTITLQATPDEGWEFSQWTIGQDTFSENPMELTINENLSITAIFQVIDAVKELSDTPLSIFPNPSKGVFTIDMGTYSGGHIQIIDSKGQVMSQFTQNNTSGQSRIDVDASSWANGIYYVVYFDQNQKKSAKISIQK